MNESVFFAIFISSWPFPNHSGALPQHSDQEDLNDNPNDKQSIQDAIQTRGKLCHVKKISSLEGFEHHQPNDQGQSHQTQGRYPTRFAG